MKEISMIGMVTGKVVAIQKQSVLIAAGPVGFEVAIPQPTLVMQGQEVCFHTYLHWSDQGPSLYGFVTPAEKSVFLVVISCSGIGPKIGLAVLADLGVNGFLEAIHTGNEKMLSKVNGIGAKKAEQMIVQLKHKIGQLEESGVVVQEHSVGAQFSTVSMALESLNYSRAEIARAMHHIKNSAGATVPSFDVLMRQALSFLSKQA